ncbi:hypothetical protein D3C76_1262110 [compost metagenome]
MAAAFGLPLPIVRTIYQLNIIRNKLAHNPDTSIQSGDIKELSRVVNSLSEIDNNFVSVEKCYIELAVRYPGERLSFGAQGNRVDFVIAGVIFYASAMQWLINDAISRRQ